jgi:hypothetical protein
MVHHRDACLWASKATATATQAPQLVTSTQAAGVDSGTQKQAVLQSSFSCAGINAIGFASIIALGQEGAD